VKKRILAMLLALILVLVPALTACSFDFGKDEKESSKKDKDDKDSDDDKDGGKNGAPYSLSYVTNVDGECSVSIKINPYAEENFVVEIPEKSPKGKVVTNVSESYFEVAGNVPRLLTSEQFDALIKKFEKSVGQNKDDQFLMTKIMTYYTPFSMDIDVADSIKNAMIEVYPIVKLTPIRVLDTSTSVSELLEISAFFEKYADYTIADHYEDVEEMNEMIEDSKEKLEPIEFGNYADKLIGVELPDTIEVIEWGAFRNCTNLSNVIMGDNVKEIGMYAFEDCTSLRTISLSESLSVIGTRAFAGTGLINVSLPNGIETLDSYAFANCTELQSINIPRNITTIREGLFSGCLSLSDVYLHDNVTSVEECAFESCHNLNFTSYGNVKYLGTSTNPYYLAYDFDDNSYNYNGEIVIASSTRVVLFRHIDHNAYYSVTFEDIYEWSCIDSYEARAVNINDFTYNTMSSAFLTEFYRGTWVKNYDPWEKPY
jgi:hypothetical protein